MHAFRWVDRKRRMLGAFCAVAIMCSVMAGCDSGGDENDNNGREGIPTNAFLSVGSFGLPMVSADGESWTQAGANTPQGRYWNLAIGNGGVTVTGPSSTTAGGQIWRFSGFPDGIDDVVTGPFLRAITFGDGQFVGVEDGGRVYTSADGLTFVLRAQIDPGAPLEIVHGSAGYLVSGNFLNADRVFRSADGVSWTATSLPEAEQVRDVFFADGRYIAVGRTDAGVNAMWTSTDLTSWGSPLPMGLDGTTIPAVVAAGEGRIAVLSSGSNAPTVYSWHSDDLGVTWTSGPVFQGSGGGPGVQDLAYGRGRFVAVTSFGVVAVTEDGSTWAVNNPNNDAFYNVLFNP